MVVVLGERGLPAKDTASADLPSSHECVCRWEEGWVVIPHFIPQFLLILPDNYESERKRRFSRTYLKKKLGYDERIFFRPRSAFIEWMKEIRGWGYHWYYSFSLASIMLIFPLC